MTTTKARLNRPAAQLYKQRLAAPPKRMLRSPWQYPGGKSKLRKRIIESLPRKRVLVEPFVGGGWVFLGADFPFTIINDKDAGIANFWSWTFTRDRDHFLLFHNTIKSLAEYEPRFVSHPDILEVSKTSGPFAFVISRLAYSGILKGNPAGGKIAQDALKRIQDIHGEDDIDAIAAAILALDKDTKKAVMAFGKKADNLWDDILPRIITVADHFRGRVKVFNMDFSQLEIPSDATIYADPPYMSELKRKGKEKLYRTGEFDHKRLADWLKSQRVPWVLSYDDHPKVWELYDGHRIERAPASYSINPGQRKNKKFELLVFSK